MKISFMKVQLSLIDLVYFLLLLTSFAFGWMGFLIFGDIAGSCNVLVVSKSAILELERERVKGEDGIYDAKGMFFGNQKEFLSSLFSMASSYEGKNTKVIILNEETGNVLGGESISREIHETLVERWKMQKQKNKASEFND